MENYLAPFFRNLLLTCVVLILVSESCDAVGHGNFRTSLRSSNPSHVRALDETISTADCDRIRSTPFSARLDLYYFYMLQYNKSMTLDLASMDRATATSLIQVLNNCTDKGEPMYSVLLSPDGQQLSNEAGGCFSDSNVTQCRVVRGKTSILLDSDVRHVEIIAYSILQQTLQDGDYLRVATGMDLLQSEFVRSISENVVMLLPDNVSNVVGSTTTPEIQPVQSPPPSSSTTKGALKLIVAVTLISAITSSIFLYGFYRQRSGEKLRATVHNHIAHYQARRRRFFDQLEEDQRLSGTPTGWMTADSAVESFPDIPAVTWSVSDLTSDSQSIRSSLPMDRIVEEGEYDASVEEDTTDGEDITLANQTEDVASNGNQCALDSELAIFIAQWNDNFPAFSTADEQLTLTLLNSDSPFDTHKPLIREVILEENEPTVHLQNHLDDYDATCAGSELNGCRYLTDNDSMEESAHDDLRSSNDIEASEVAQKRYPFVVSLLLGCNRQRETTGGATLIENNDEESADSLTIKSSDDDDTLALLVPRQYCRRYFSSAEPLSMWENYAPDPTERNDVNEVSCVLREDGIVQLPMVPSLINQDMEKEQNVGVIVATPQEVINQEASPKGMFDEMAMTIFQNVLLLLMRAQQQKLLTM